MDLLQSVLTAPKVLPDVLPAFAPYASVLALFALFVKWNGGIVLGKSEAFIDQIQFLITKRQSGDKSNHIPSLHIPQVYYFVAFATLFGWPALISGEGGVTALVRDVRKRMFGGPGYAHVSPFRC